MASWAKGGKSGIRQTIAGSETDQTPIQTYHEELFRKCR